LEEPEPVSPSLAKSPATPLKELPVELLEESFEKVKPRAEEFAASFYQNLFAAHPEVKPLFASTDMAQQEQKLLQALILVVENLRNPDVLGKVLQDLGARHVGYGTNPRHYGPVGEALLATFEQYLQEDWTEEIKQGWLTAYQGITAQMLRGAGVEIPAETPPPPQKKAPVLEKTSLDSPTPAPSPPQPIFEAEVKELPIELLEESFEKIKPRAEEFAARFYQNLFAAHPEVEPLFAGTEMAKQEKKLLQSLILVVENLRNPNVLGKVLQDLGARHVGYGTNSQHYEPVGETLLATFEEYLQADWTEDVRQGWVAAYQAISTQMLLGARTVSVPEVTLEKTAIATPEPPPTPPNSPVSKPQQILSDELQNLTLGQLSELITGTIAQQYRQFRDRAGSKQAGETFKKTWDAIVEAFWTQPAWLIATISAIVIAAIFLVADENSPLGKILGGAETISVVVALVLFVKEAPDRRKQFHYQAWSIVDAAQNVKVSYARILALQDLNEDGVALRGLDAPGSDLADIHLPKANLSQAKLNKADLSYGNLSHSNLGNAELSQAKLVGTDLSYASLDFTRLNRANLSSANLSSANLICADLSQANMSNANLKDASLSGVNLNDAYLNGANLKGAKVSLAELKAAYLEGAILPNGVKYQSKN
ncbi:MAG: globin domain-containing protein, partial [Cyanobacteriota bacterium]|nr:globin domain-containing protein [Cyanobacteriota bacterium]